MPTDTREPPRLRAFHGDPAIKAKYLKRVRAHEAADEIIKGRYWEAGKGCAIGCSIHGSEHKAYETELGIPEWLAHLEDTIFEGLPNGEAKSFPAAFLDAIKPGAHLEPVRWRFCAFVLRENIERVLLLKIDDALKKKVVDAIRGCLTLHENAVEAGQWNVSSAAWAARAARAATWAARSSAESAARSSAKSAAWASARSARSAEWAARSSAESAAWAAARSAARSSACIRYRDELLRLLRDA